MFSCIIPTMWQSLRTPQLLSDLVNCENVGEIILIDNNYMHAPEIIKHIKIKQIKLPINIMVNAAWNIGVLMSRNENIAIINDDINFNPAFLANYDNGSLEHIGIVGMAWENYQLKQDTEIRLTTMSQRPYGWGCLMLMHVSKYEPIPVELLIANGDDWLAQHALPFVLHGLSVQSEISTTSRLPEFGLIQLKDNEVFNAKYKR